MEKAVAKIGELGINRIRLEFKEIIVKGDPAVFVRINRIRLEFKGVSDSG